MSKPKNKPLPIRGGGYQPNKSSSGSAVPSNGCICGGTDYVDHPWGRRYRECSGIKCNPHNRSSDLWDVCAEEYVRSLKEYLISTGLTDDECVLALRHRTSELKSNLEDLSEMKSNFYQKEIDRCKEEIARNNARIAKLNRLLDTPLSRLLKFFKIL